MYLLNCGLMAKIFLFVLKPDGIKLNKKNIIIITHHYPPEATGGASRIYEMAESLKSMYNVSILCPPPTFPFTKYKKVRYIYHKEKNGDNIARLWTFQPSGHNPSFWKRILYYLIFPIFASFYLITQLRDASLVIISVPPSPLLITSLVTRLFRKKIVIDVRDLWTEVAVSLSYIKESSLILKLTRRFEKYCLEKSDLIITNSRIMLSTLDSNLKISHKHKTRYFPFSVNLDSFKHVSQVSKKMEIVYIGNLGTAQNINTLIEAFSLVLEKIPDLNMNFYGGGDQEEELKHLAKDLKLEQKIQFNNPVPRNEIPAILSGSMLGLIPLSSNKAVRYALPTKSFEYFALGLPVVAYGSSEELECVINESGAGIFVRGDDKRKIAEAIVKIITDKDMREKCSANGRKFAEKSNFHSLVADIGAVIGEK